MQTLWQDLRYGARMLLKNPSFTLIAVFTLALGIGANTTIFSVLNALLLKPLPGIADHERIAQIGMTTNGQGFNSVSYADYRDYRDQNSTFAGIAAESEQQFHFGTDKTAERIKGSLVTGNYFEVLGVRATQGRLLLANIGLHARFISCHGAAVRACAGPAIIEVEFASAAEGRRRFVRRRQPRSLAQRFSRRANRIVAGFVGQRRTLRPHAAKRAGYQPWIEDRKSADGKAGSGTPKLFRRAGACVLSATA
jgi:hypothetical protein